MPNIEIPLDLPEVRVLKYEADRHQIVITVESTRQWAICHKCGQEIRDFHSYNRQLRLRHMPILGRPVIIEIRPKRFRCPTCDGNPRRRKSWTGMTNVARIQKPTISGC